MGKICGLIELVEIIQKNVGKGVVFSLSENGNRYILERSKNFGIIIGNPDSTSKAFICPNYSEMDEWDLSKKIDEYIDEVAKKDSEPYNRSKINVIELTYCNYD